MSKMTLTHGDDILTKQSGAMISQSEQLATITNILYIQMAILIIGFLFLAYKMMTSKAERFFIQAEIAFIELIQAIVHGIKENPEQKQMLNYMLRYGLGKAMATYQYFSNECAKMAAEKEDDKHPV